MEWKKVKLGEVCRKVCSGGTPKSTNHSYYVGGNIPWLNTKEVNFSYIDRTEGYITQEGLDNSSAKWIPANCVIVAMYGATAGKVAVNNIPLTTNQACCNLEIDSSLADFRYTYYYLCGKYTELASLANGGAQQNLNAQIIKDFDLPLPPLSTQRRIAAILSSLDAQIENNNRINRNLEEQAQALFKSWFVDFEPWGGKMPEGWREGKLGEYCKCVLGGTPSRNKEEYWNGDIAWINSGEVNRFRIITPSEWITKLGMDKSATKLLPAKTTVLAITGATLGQVSLVEIDTCANQSVIGVLQNEQVPYEFIYPLMNEKIKELVLHQTGGAQQHINKDNVESMSIIMPSTEVLNQYKEMVAPMYETIANNEFKNLRLANLRDTLLPKLMKGEIEV